MVVLVTGANGQLGQSLQFIAEKYPLIRFVFCSSTELDITNNLQCESVFEEVKPQFCINAAAYTAVDKAETEQDKAFLVNAVGPENLAKVCNAYGATFLHVSTDFVFNGNATTPYNEDHQTDPIGVYGASKLKGEQAIQSICHKYFIIRTSWVYSQFANNFMKTMLRLAKERTSLGIVNDQIGTPTNAVDLAEAIIQIVLSESKNYGIYNFSNEGQCSWFEFAQEIFRVNNVKIDLNSITTDQFPTPAKRPNYSVLDKSKIKNTFGIAINSWEYSLSSIILQ